MNPKPMTTLIERAFVPNTFEEKQWPINYKHLKFYYLLTLIFFSFQGNTFSDERKVVQQHGWHGWGWPGFRGWGHHQKKAEKRPYWVPSQMERYVFLYKMEIGFHKGVFILIKVIYFSHRKRNSAKFWPEKKLKNIISVLYLNCLRIPTGIHNFFCIFIPFHYFKWVHCTVDFWC